MTSRFDVERAVLASELPKLARLLALVLLVHVDNNTAAIPAKFTPSLSTLATESGLDRSTVQRVLRELESAGWLHRQRPAAEASRKGARTRYRLAIPSDSTADPNLGAHDTYVGAHDTQPRCTCHLRVGAHSNQPRCTQHPNHSCSEDTHSTPRASARNEPSTQTKSTNHDAAVETVRDHLAELYGTEYDRRDLLDSVSAFLRGRDINDPLAYVRQAVKNNPEQFRPTPGPPRFNREEL